MRAMRGVDVLLVAVLLAAPALAVAQPTAHEVEALGRGIEDLMRTHGAEYPYGPGFLARLEALARDASGSAEAFSALRSEALVEASPRLATLEIVLVKRAVVKADEPNQLGMPTNHTCNTALPRAGYDNEIAVLAPSEGSRELRTLFRPQHGGYVGEVDLHWSGQRLLFTMSDGETWKVWEVGVDGSGLRQVSQTPPDVDCMDACYLPNGDIIFGSTASYQSVPCWHGQQRVSNLYTMHPDGSGMRQLCFDQDHDFHPSVLSNGQVVYHRWDYTGINHIFLRQLMVMNPDGSGQRAVYGSNSWFPNALYFPRALPGDPGKLACILSGYHGVPRMGQLAIVDTSKGSYDADGLVTRISGRGEPFRPAIRDNLVDNDWPKFLHPYPLSDTQFLVSCWPDRDASWGIYLADIFDNLVLLREEPGYALLEPVPLDPRPVPPVVSGSLDPTLNDGTVYLHDVYAGPGLAGVPRGTIKSLRVLAYHFGYRGLAGPHKVGYGGPWEVMRILGTVPLQPDGSALFRVPANTPLAVQALDAERKAVQLMRSWFTLMPGESVSCIGCHERLEEAPPGRVAGAGVGQPVEITPWRGPPRGFDFAREVQPVLDRHCVSCHDGTDASRPDLRREQQGAKLQTWPIQYVERLHPKMREDTGGRLSYTPAYDAMVRRIRRVGIEDDVSLLLAGEYHADTSPLVRMLRKGHGGVRLDAEAWDRLITWIDLNGPCHGTWGEVYPIPDGAHERRMELRRMYGGPDEDPEAIPDLAPPDTAPIPPEPLAKPDEVALEGWPFDASAARRMQDALGSRNRAIDLGDGVLELVRVPGGEFIMGDPEGEPDEWPPTRVHIDKPFWMGVCEVTNRQLRQFDPGHDCRYYARRHAHSDDQGLPLNGPDQPAVRVSWEQAMAFCGWLSERTGVAFRLPTEAEWEWACRAGSSAPLSFGDVASDFSLWANVGDRAFSLGYGEGGKQLTGGLDHLLLEGADIAADRFSDGAAVTAPVGSFRPNAWGLHDMHGNAAEWVLAAYAPYPYGADDGRNDGAATGRKMARGGSFFDHPKHCRSGARFDYPYWQRVYNVGFRVVATDE